MPGLPGAQDRNQGRTEHCPGLSDPTKPQQMLHAAPQGSREPGPRCVVCEGLAGCRRGLCSYPRQNERSWLTGELHVLPGGWQQMKMVRPCPANCEISVKCHHLRAWIPLSKVVLQHLLIPLQLWQVNLTDKAPDREEMLKSSQSRQRFSVTVYN